MSAARDLYAKHLMGSRAEAYVQLTPLYPQPYPPPYPPLIPQPYPPPQPPPLIPPHYPPPLPPPTGTYN